MAGRVQQREYQEQCALIQWCESQYFDHFDVAGRRIQICLADLVEASLNGAFLNGNGVQRAKQWGRMAKAGAKKSAPDLAINYPRNGYHGMKIEMKKCRRDFRSPSEIRRAQKVGQADYLNLMNRLDYFSCFAFGWVEAAIKICEYMDWDPRAKGLC